MTETQNNQEKPKRTPAKTVYDALKKAGVVKSEDDLTPEMLEFMKETNEAAALLKENKVGKERKTQNKG